MITQKTPLSPVESSLEAVEGVDASEVLFESLDEDDESSVEPKALWCIKTQKRRDLKMKKHRRAKRKKVMLLKLKAQGKI